MASEVTLIDDEDLEYADATAEEREALKATEIVLDKPTQQWVDDKVDKLVIISNELSGHKFRGYQEPLARRIFESLIIGDAEIVTALFSRQSGKSDTVASVVATVMVMFPRMAVMYPRMMGRFREGVKVGAFAPVDEQADTLFGRIVERLTSDRAEKIFADPDINERVSARGRVIKLTRCKSECRKTTAHPRAQIEGRTYHLILIDECQGADNGVVNNSIMPMATETRGTKVFTGTPGYTKNVFYTKIQENKRQATKRGRHRQNHFQYDWKDVSKYSKDYEFSARKEMLRLGEDSDEFRRMYCNQWLLEKGMYTTAARLDQLGDISMQRTVNAWHKTPVVVGIDCGRKQDRTIVTVVYVDWDHPDRFGIYTHRILDWLDLEGMDWENQYHRIVEFLSNYKIWKIGIDTNGLGDVVVSRLRTMMPNVEFVDLGSSVGEQSRRWKHLRQLLDLGRISWPAGSKVKPLRRWRRFYQEMTDLEIDYRGPNVLGQAPKENDAHDDYPDSLSMACILTTEESQETVEVTSNPFYPRGRRY